MDSQTELAMDVTMVEAMVLVTVEGMASPKEAQMVQELEAGLDLFQRKSDFLLEHCLEKMASLLATSSVLLMALHLVQEMASSMVAVMALHLDSLMAWAMASYLVEQTAEEQLVQKSDHQLHYLVASTASM